MAHPLEKLEAIAKECGLDLGSEAFAAEMDKRDTLAHLRQEFLIPKNSELQHTDASKVDPEAPCVYLCGNSLGLQPKGTRQLVVEELDKWSKRGVTGHFDDSARPWVSIDENVIGQSAAVVGALPSEVAVMNSLTVNLHLLLTAFYSPTAARHKILMEAKAFPSDYHAICSQIRQRGYEVASSLIEMAPREGEHCVRDEDILDVIAKEGDAIAVVLFSGVQFYNGQLFDMEGITKAAKAKGCFVGFDLAHAVGNVPMKLHDWGVDFACWCSYKYLNSGPGGIAGAYVHESNGWASSKAYTGWWGVDPKTRFKMDYEQSFLPGVRGMQLSNPPVLQTVALLGSLNVFAMTTMDTLRAKSVLLTAYLEYLLKNTLTKRADGTAPCQIITPANPDRRGCQLSLLFAERIRPVFDEVERMGVICDMREPNVMRIAPTPLYNTFADVRTFIARLDAALAAVHAQ